jgi:hypothetical protein
METEKIESRRAPWRMLSLGATVWAPFGDHGWRPGIVIGLGKNRGDSTVCIWHSKREGRADAWPESSTGANRS